MTFKDLFSGHSEVYQAARPTYPAALFDWLAAQAPARDLVWDVGCGNGQASTALAARFARVHASDPSAQQIANAEARPNIDYRVEPAERCSLADAGADLVTVAQAMHWFDLPRFHAEVRRVLKPRGVFAAWTYADCRVDTAVDAVKQRLYVDLTGPYWQPERVHVENGYRDLPFPFEPIAAPAFEMVMRWNAAQFLAYLRSWSGTQGYLKAHGVDPVTLIEPDLLVAWGDPSSLREVRWDFHLRCGRV
ncbi:class I SAM-dependent methyltransferase [Dokdonella sp.]|uniref:class I SAM-dependent methyltransferase n=1 Tax=Dokdonella sp. TaxID=2291710 RepID=UPI001B0161F8|nr:class I SAM-dependent methyltransferase [Dokdonella sp.]MBO9661762.1 class I SAM-dependent methyltransferase [Dokdonella sp.]